MLPPTTEPFLKSLFLLAIQILEFLKDAHHMLSFARLFFSKKGPFLCIESNYVIPYFRVCLDFYIF